MSPHTAATVSPRVHPFGVRPFGERLEEALDRRGPLCVGIDPHPQLLRRWGLPLDERGLLEFGRRVIDAAAGRVAVIKPQVAFFEQYGPGGLESLAEIISLARASELLVIADAKRGDIGTTMAGYADAWLGPDAPWPADALTVSPYLGFGALQPAVETAQARGAGLFVLALTSNPEGAQVQLAETQAGGRVAEEIVRAAATALPSTTGALGSVGLVVGATTAALAAEHGIDLTVGRVPLLAPGFGAQGASSQDLRQGFGPASRQVLVNSSRQILRVGPAVTELSEAIESTRRDLASFR